MLKSTSKMFSKFCVLSSHLPALSTLPSILQHPQHQHHEQCVTDTCCNSSKNTIPNVKTFLHTTSRAAPYLSVLVKLEPGVKAVTDGPQATSHSCLSVPGKALNGKYLSLHFSAVISRKSSTAFQRVKVTSKTIGYESMQIFYPNMNKANTFSLIFISSIICTFK